MSGETYATRIGKHGLDFIKTWEGLPRCKGDRKHVCPYNDSVGNCTIGYGRLIRKSACTPADLKLRWTLEEAEDDLRDLASKAEYEGVIREFSRKHGLNQCQFDALMSFVWNAGKGGFTRLTRSLPLEEWEPTLLQRLVTEHIYATVRTSPAAPTKDKQGRLVVRDPTTGRLIPLPTINTGKNGTTITFKDPRTGKTVTIRAPVPSPKAGPRRVVLEGLVKRRTAEMKLFMAVAGCPCGGAAGKTPSTWDKP